MSRVYDLIVVGTGFSAAFFLSEYLREAPNNAKVLVLEKGVNVSHQDQRRMLAHSPIDYKNSFSKSGMDWKRWQFTLGYGGSSNCWSACVPRMLPSDFELQRKYGVGSDWPFDYDELEPYYGEVEAIMGVSGPPDYSLSHRSTPFPLPPHQFNDPDKLLKKAFPDHYYQQCTARPSEPFGERPGCCGSNSCHLCPVNAKFTILNGLRWPFEDSRVEVQFGASVHGLVGETDVQGVRYRGSRGEQSALAGNVVLAANAIFNADILLRSGHKHPDLGRYLNEQVSKTVHIDLKGVDNFSGSTLITGQGYMFYDGEHRRDRGAVLLEHFNRPSLRLEKGKWRQRMELKFIVEDLPDRNNYIDSSFGVPRLHFEGFGDYALRSLDSIPSMIEVLSEALPIEGVRLNKEINPTEAHIQGTVRMANTPEKGVVDSYCRHFSYENLFVLGSSAFPTCPAANPTLTLSAMAMRSARHLVKG